MKKLLSESGGEQAPQRSSHSLSARVQKGAMLRLEGIEYPLRAQVILLLLSIAGDEQVETSVEAFLAAENAGFVTGRISENTVDCSTLKLTDAGLAVAMVIANRQAMAEAQKASATPSESAGAEEGQTGGGVVDTHTTIVGGLLRKALSWLRR
jgi:hypothetical protein